MFSIDELRDFFDKELINLLVPLENARIKGMRRFYRLGILALIMGLLLGLAIGYRHDNLIVVAVIILMFILGTAIETLSGTNMLLREKYKKDILPGIFSRILPDFDYWPNQKIANETYNNSLLFPQEVNVVEGEDFMRFTIDGVDVMLCESKVFGYGPQAKMFQGIFISAAFNKSVTSKTFIFPRKSTSWYRKLRFKVLGPSYQVKLEDPEFDKDFIVLGEDQVEARYILSTSLMKRILEYKRKLNSEIAFSFISDRMYCSIRNSRNLFEPALFNSFLDFSFVLKSYEPVIFYTAIVKDLNLNLRIWSES